MEVKEYPEEIDFQKYWLILKRHWPPATAVASISIVMAVLLGFSKQPMYEAVGKLRLKKENTTSALVTQAGEKIGKLDSLNSKDTPLDTEAEVIRSAPIVNQTIAELNLKNQKGVPIAYEDFIGILKVKSIRGTDILTISYSSRNRKEAMTVVDELMKIYIKTNILTNRAEPAAAQEFISEQLPQVEEGVRKAEAGLRSFKEQNNVVDLEQRSKATETAVDSLDEQIKSTQTEIEKTTGRITELQKELGMTAEEAIAKNALNQSIGVQQVFEKLKQVEEQLATEQTRFLEGSPTIINLKDQQASLKLLLEERTKQVLADQKQVPYESLQKSDTNQGGNLHEKLTETLVNSEAEHKALINQLNSLIQIRSDYKQQLNQLPKLEQTQGELQRKIDAAQDNYKLLLKNREEARLTENQQIGNADIVSPATAPNFPSPSNKKIFIGAGVVVGSLLYVITAFILELNDSSIKTTKEVRSIFKYTLLGMIPCSSRKARFTRVKTEQTLPEYQVRDSPHSIISQTYRMLQANLKFISPDQELKVIVVTSSVPKEGKSTVSTNLAVALAQIGCRVLLVDADLHHPQQHHVWNLTNEVGLSEVIVSQTELKQAVRQVKPNLDVLPSGVIPPNSLALLDSKRMSSLIDDFSKTYEFVIIDTSPLLLVADALTLGKMSDGVLLVSRPGVIDRASANAARDLLRQSGQNVLGLVINGLRLENEPDSYFHHAKAYSEGDTKSPLGSFFKS